MKQIALLLCVFTMAGFSQEWKAVRIYRPGNPVGGLVENRGRLEYKQQPGALSRSHPFRVVDGELVNLTRAFQCLDIGDHTCFPKHWGSYSGKVIQVIGENVLIEADGTFMLLADYPEVSSLLDGSNVSCIAKVAGRYQYVAVNGATKTVPKLTYGSLPNDEQWKQLIRKFRETREAADAQIDAQNALTSVRKSEAELAAKKRVIDLLQARIAKGSADAAFDLGMRHLKGDGVETNKQEAIRLFQVSASRGNKDAERQLKELSEAAN